jgi:hypothetical protein
MTRPLLLTVAVLLATGCQSAIVGAACDGPFVACDGRCVDLSTDPLHCGACGAACPVLAVCVQSVCSGAQDGGFGLDGGEGGVVDPDGGEGGVVDRDGSTGVPDGSVDGGEVFLSCGIGELRCQDVCVDVRRDPSNCGQCGRTCAAGERCAEGVCEEECPFPLEACGASCVDVASDPDNCGSCGVRCPSGICEVNACASPTAGHLVVIGHDYTVGRAGMNRVAGNALFLASGNPVRVLRYRGRATPQAALGVSRAIQQVAVERGRSWTETSAVADEVSLQLATADAFVIDAQGAGTSTDLEDLGRLWANAMDMFLRRGGVVVLFDGPAGHGGTHQILEAAALFDASGTTDVSGDELTVVNAVDGVAVGVPLRYRAEVNTVRFDGVVSEVVVADGEAPVVLHRVVLP